MPHVKVQLFKGKGRWACPTTLCLSCAKMAEPVIETKKVKILWDVTILQTDHLIEHRRTVIVVVEKDKNSSGDEIANVNFYAVRP